MTDQHPFPVPPPELVKQWRAAASNVPASLSTDPGGRHDYIDYIATQAARWGADTELEACCECIDKLAHVSDGFLADLRADRRPTSNRSHGVIDRVWTYMTDEAPATHTQAELAVEAVEMWLRHQGQTEAAELLKNQQIG